MSYTHTAEAQDIDLVADIVADAFLRLDVIRYLVPDLERRRTITRAWYRLHIAHAIAGAGQVVLTGEGGAAAVWLDRTREVTEPENYAEELAALAGDDLPHFQHLDTQMEAYHPIDPHWHLLFLAVRPGRQGQGLGSLLMSYTHHRLDAEGIPAYLEATNERNQRLYLRHGYTDLTPKTISVGDSEPLRRMWRPAHPPQR